MGQYLDDNGLRYLWTKIKNTFVAKESGKGLSSNDYTDSEKSKLSGIANNANNYSLPTASSTTLGGVKVGSGLNIDNGVLSAASSGGLKVVGEGSKSSLSSVTFSEPAKIVFTVYTYYVGNTIYSQGIVLPVNQYFSDLSFGYFSSRLSADGLTLNIRQNNSGVSFRSFRYIAIG